MYYLLIGLCLFFDIVYIICKAKKKNVIGLFAKLLAAFCFVTMGYMGYLANKTSFTYYASIALLLDAIGDVCLGLRNIFAKNIMFFAGSLSFLVGHIVFVKALFFLNNPFIFNCVIIAVIVGAIVYYLLSRVCTFHKVFVIVGIIYSILLSMFVFLSLGVYVNYQTAKNLLFLIGAILFASSDILLILYNFSKKQPWLHPVYSLLYFIGQIFISFSLHL